MEQNLEEIQILASQSIQKAISLSSERKYPEALELIANAENILKKAPDKYLITLWAYLYDSKYSILTEIQEDNEAIKVCNEAIKKLENAGDWPYLEEYKIVRHTIRTSYKMLAWNAYMSTESTEDLTKAVILIDKCFNTVSPIDVDPFIYHYEIRALIYKKALIYDTKYETEYYRTLERIIAENVELCIPEIKEAIMRFHENNPMKKIRFGSEGEKWPDIILRYQNIFQKDALKFEYTTLNEDKIKKLEEQSRIKCPESLKNFLLTTGQFKTSDKNPWTYINLYSPPYNVGLFDFINDILGDFFFNEFGEEKYKNNEAIQFINQSYAVIGYYYLTEQEQFYFIAGENGKMGIILFCVDSYPELYNDLLNKSYPILPYDNFEEMMSRFFNVIINFNYYNSNNEWDIHHIPTYKLMEKEN